MSHYIFNFINCKIFADTNLTSLSSLFGKRKQWEDNTEHKQPREDGVEKLYRKMEKAEGRWPHKFGKEHNVIVSQHLAKQIFFFLNETKSRDALIDTRLQLL